MRAIRQGLFTLLLAWPLFLFSGPQVQTGQVVQLNVDGPIGPATSDYLRRGLLKAHKRQAPLVVLRMDTPGGLDTAMRRIIQDIITSPVPVATFVAPGGARAASAGTYILYASHVAAMAPGTNLGAATPVRIGGVPNPADSGRPEPREGKHPDKPADSDAMHQKVINDASAYIRSLAQMRGRNVTWAEQAVRGAASLPAEEAVKMRVIDLVAKDVTDLLQRLDGRRLEVPGQTLTLATAGLSVTLIQPDWRNRLLSVITDPNVAYILMLLGIYGLFFELWNPGFVLPGVVGAICLVLALFAFNVLSVSYAGMGLILLGIAFMVAETFMPSFGALGIGGVVAFVAGSVILLDTDAPGFGISYWLIGTIALTSAAFFMTVASFALRARRRAPVSGSEEMIGSVGVALSGFTHTGRIRIHSEDWQARSAVPVKHGQRVRVMAREGLTLVVRPEVTTEDG